MKVNVLTGKSSIINMADCHFSLSSSTYKTQVFEGFSRLQQCDEFVDMTLATGDHFVKVHKTLLALASPYLKTLLQSIPCQHPVLFLTNVRYEDLNFILEYIYTGEVKIPNENIDSFLEAARAIHISGLENILFTNTYNKPRKEEEASHVNPKPVVGEKRFPAVKANIIINENDFNLQIAPNMEIPNIQDHNGKHFPLPVPTNEPASEENNHLNLVEFNNKTGRNNDAFNLFNDNANENINKDTVNNVGTTSNLLTSENIDNIPMIIDGIPELTAQPFLNIGNKELIVTNTVCNDNNDGTNISVNSSNINQRTSFANLFQVASKSPSMEEQDAAKNMNDLGNGEIEIQSTTNEITESNVNKEQTNTAEEVKDSILYTISKRGSLQLIMNRFMYYTHYTRDGGRKRRWRCIDYRDKRCQASIDAEGDVIVTRKHQHSHPNHDSKIWNKVVKSRVFASLKMAQDIINENQSMSKPEEVVVSD